MKTFSLATTAIAVVFALTVVPANAEDAKDTWNLEDLYPTVADWEKARTDIESQIESTGDCKGRLGDNAKTLTNCLDDFYAAFRGIQRYFGYASMGSDADTSVPEAAGRRQTAQIVFTKFNQATSFVQPELLEVGADKLKQFMAKEKGLAPYAYFIENTLRQAPHTLTEEGENIVAASGNVRAAPFNMYRTFTNAELPWPTITLSDGTEAKLDQAGYTRYRSGPNREDRKKVFDAFFGAWKDFEGTVGTSLSAGVASNYFQASVRKYDNSLQSAISSGNIPEAVYRTLVSETNANLSTLHRYFKLRARMLGVDDMAYYDIYPPLVKLELVFPLDLGKTLTLAAIEPLGKDYVAAVKLGFDERWMDALNGSPLDTET